MSNETFSGARTPENQAQLAARQREVETAAAKEAIEAAARETEAIIADLTARFGEREFTPEQCVFALALATINFRETLPEPYGGKAMFDRVAGEARAYYDANVDK